jgi:hypothetical protein
LYRLKDMERTIHATMDRLNAAIATTHERLSKASEGGVSDGRADRMLAAARSGPFGTVLDVAAAAEARLRASRETLAAARVRVGITRALLRRRAQSRPPHRVSS